VSASALDSAVSYLRGVLGRTRLVDTDPDPDAQQGEQADAPNRTGLLPEEIARIDYANAAFIVDALHVEGVEGVDAGGGVTLRLFDGTEEALDPEGLSVGEGGAVYARVKGGLFEARFSRHAQTQLADILVDADPPRVRVGGRTVEVVLRPT